MPRRPEDFDKDPSVRMFMQRELKNSLIDEYLDMCNRAGLEPPYSTSFQRFAQWLFDHYTVSCTKKQ